MPQVQLTSSITSSIIASPLLLPKSDTLPGNVYTAGHSLGGFTAASCCILDERILHAVTFESPGLTTFYHKLAGEIGNEQYWQVGLTGPPALVGCFDAKRGSSTRKATCAMF